VITTPTVTKIQQRAGHRPDLQHGDDVPASTSTNRHCVSHFDKDGTNLM